VGLGAVRRSPAVRWGTRESTLSTEAAALKRRRLLRKRGWRVEKADWRRQARRRSMATQLVRCILNERTINWTKQEFGC